MNKLEYFLVALENRLFIHKEWVIRCFSFVEAPESSIPYMLNRDSKGYYCFNNDSGRVDIEGSSKERLYDFREPVKLKPRDVPNLGEDLESTYGRLFVNYLIFVYPFGTKIPYMNESIKIGNVEKIIEKRLVDDDVASTPDNITVSEYLRFNKAVFQLTGFNSLCVPSASPKSLTHNPETIKLRDRLLAENKGHLDDPVVIAKIETALMDSDREWVDDDAKDFYIGKKSFPSRKRSHLMFGLETAFKESNEKGELVVNSLTEGFDFKNHMTEASNSLREGSFFRGAETQLGGVVAKTAIRASQNIKIRGKDCGSKLGISEVITSHNRNGVIGMYYLDTKGTPVLITSDNISGLLNTRILRRSTMLCKTPHGDYCETCMGVENSKNPDGAIALSSGIGATFLLEKMKKMHGSARAVAIYDFKMAIQ